MSDDARLRPPLVGREEQLEKMMAKLAYAMAGQGATVLITGEAGAGKTRLAQDFESLASKTRCVCTSVHCQLEEGPYAPFQEVIAQLARSDSSLPSLPAYQEFCPGVARPREGRAELKEDRALFAALELLRHASRGDTLVLRLDDLHLADARTIQMLHFLSRGLVDQRALVIGTYSDDELFDREERAHPLIETVRIMKREGLCEEIPLLPLTEKEMEEALSDLLEADIDLEVLDILFRESGGNPQIAVELTLGALRGKALTKRGDRMVLTSKGSMDIPPPLRDWVARKLAQLPPEHLSVLECAALCGDRFDAELVAKVIGRPKLETLELLDAAVRQYRLYVEGREGYQFRWGVVRRVAIEEMEPGKAKRLKEGIGKQLFANKTLPGGG